jgi:hypothetical protein
MIKNTILLGLLGIAFSLFSVDGDNIATDKYEIVDIQSILSEDQLALVDTKLDVLINKIFPLVNQLFTKFKDEETGKKLETILNKYDLEIIFNILINYAKKINAISNNLIDSTDDNNIQDLQEVISLEKDDSNDNRDDNDDSSSDDQSQNIKFSEEELNDLKGSLTEMMKLIYPELVNTLKDFDNSEEGKELNNILISFDVFPCYDFQFSLMEKSK